jgi:hypothetical protein
VQETRAQQIGRRDLLKKGMVVGGVGAAAGLLATATGAGCASAQESQKVTFDVACLGGTLRIQPTDGNAEGDLSGNTFYVEGLIYDEGTIDSDGFDPASAAAIGRWFCRGWFTITPDRAEPHVITTQEYIFPEITASRLFPPDTMTSSGLEGSDTEEQTPIRSVIGGTGRYAGAQGVVLQHGNGRNTTELRGLGEKAPNFRFEFDVIILEALANPT